MSPRNRIAKNLKYPPKCRTHEGEDLVEHGSSWFCKLCGHDCEDDEVMWEGELIDHRKRRVKFNWRK